MGAVSSNDIMSQPVVHDGYYTLMWDYEASGWTVMRERQRLGHVGEDGDMWWSQGPNERLRQLGHASRAKGCLRLWKRLLASTP